MMLNGNDYIRCSNTYIIAVSRVLVVGKALFWNSGLLESVRSKIKLKQIISRIFIIKYKAESTLIHKLINLV